MYVPKKILTSSFQQQCGSTAAPPSSNLLQPPNFAPQVEEGTARTSDDNNDCSEVNPGLSRAVCNESNNSGHIKKSNQKWMKPKTTLQLSSIIQKKPPFKKEDSFLKSFSTLQIPETQETVEDTGSEGTQRGRKVQVPRTVVNPENNFYFYWLCLTSVCILYDLWTFILIQSFTELQIMYQFFWMICDVIVNGVFVFDVVVQFRTGYLERGLLVYDSKKLAKHYMASRTFLVDIAALMPLTLLQLKISINPIIQVIRLFKVYRAVKCYYMVESRTVYPNFWRTINQIHILFLLAHWLGCFYFLLSKAEDFQGNWTYPHIEGDYATLTRKYLGSLYWSILTLTTIGNTPTPETNAEYVFTIVSFFIGLLIYATIVGQVSNIIQNKNANRLEFERLLDNIKKFTRRHEVPEDMKRRVLRWYDYAWSRGRIQEGGDINDTALRRLPNKFKTELALHAYLSVLKKVTIFQECQPEFLHYLVLKMKTNIFTPGDCICRKGEIATDMFIIADGILEVISETGHVLSTMETGDSFGEIGILNLDGLNKRIADVRSVGYSELFYISRKDVLAAMKHYPEAQQMLQTLGRKRLQEAKNMARKCAKNDISPDQPRDHSASKRIVHKLRTDVKDREKKDTKRRLSAPSLLILPTQLTPTASKPVSSSETISPSSLSPLEKNLSPLRKKSKSSSPGKLQSPTTKKSRISSSGSSDSNSKPKLSYRDKILQVQSDEIDNEMNICIQSGLTRSHSHGSTMDKWKLKKKLTDVVASHGSNETLETQTFKSKSLSEDVTLAESAVKNNVMRKLIIDTTIEDCAARHSIFAKSLPPPPGSILVDIVGNAFKLRTPKETVQPTIQTSGITLPDASVMIHQSQVDIPDPSSVRNKNIDTNLKTQYKLQSHVDSVYDYKSLRSEDIRVREKPKLTRVSEVANKQKLQRDSIKEQEYLDEILFGINKVIRGLYEVHGKFQESLENEIRKRDEIMSQLQTPIQELERIMELRNNETSGFEKGFMRGASLNTVFTSSRQEIKASDKKIQTNISAEALSDELSEETYLREHDEKMKQRKSLDDQNYQESIELQDSTWSISQHMTSENRPLLSREQSGHCTNPSSQQHQHRTFSLGSFFGCSRGMPKPNSNDIVLDIDSDRNRRESTSMSLDSDFKPAPQTPFLEEFVDTDTKRGRGFSAQGNIAPITGSESDWEIMMLAEELEKRERNESISHRYPYRPRDLEEASDTPQREDSPDDLSNLEDTNSTTQLPSQPVGKTNSTGRHRAGSAGEQMRPDASEPQPVDDS